MTSNTDDPIDFAEETLGVNLTARERDLAGHILRALLHGTEGKSQ